MVRNQAANIKMTDPETKKIPAMIPVPMDDETARTEARRRWGPGAWIDDELSSRHQVGYVDETEEVIMGSGATWEEAFADADRKGAEDADSVEK
jgi:hypothetical protein